MTVLNSPVVIESPRTGAEAPDAAPPIEKRPNYSFLCISDVGSQLTRKNLAAALEAAASRFGFIFDKHRIIKFHLAKHNSEKLWYNVNVL